MIIHEYYFSLLGYNRRGVRWWDVEAQFFRQTQDMVSLPPKRFRTKTCSSWGQICQAWLKIQLSDPKVCSVRWHEADKVPKDARWSSKWLWRRRKTLHFHRCHWESRIRKNLGASCHLISGGQRLCCQGDHDIRWGWKTDRHDEPAPCLNNESLKNLLMPAKCESTFKWNCNWKLEMLWLWGGWAMIGPVWVPWWAWWAEWWAKAWAKVWAKAWERVWARMARARTRAAKATWCGNLCSWRKAWAKGWCEEDNWGPAIRCD